MDKEPVNELLNITKKAFNVLYSRKSYKPDDLMNVPEFREVVEKTTDVFSSAIPHQTPKEMKAYLEKDAFIFSGRRIETGNTCPNIYTLYRISQHLEIELSELVQISEDREKSV